MARNVVNSRLFSARNFILAENTQFRSSPLLVAAKRWQPAVCQSLRNKKTNTRKIINLQVDQFSKENVQKYYAENLSEFRNQNRNDRKYKAEKLTKYRN